MPTHVNKWAAEGYTHRFAIAGPCSAASGFVDPAPALIPAVRAAVYIKRNILISAARAPRRRRDAAAWAAAYIKRDSYSQLTGFSSQTLNYVMMLTNSCSLGF